MQRIKNISNQKLRFLIVGSLNTLIDFSIYSTLSFTILSPVFANFVSSSCAFVISFFLNRNITFQNTARIGVRQVSLFIAVTLIGIWGLQSLTIWLSIGLLQSFLPEGIAIMGAKVFATLISMIWNYVLYSRIVFRT